MSHDNVVIFPVAKKPSPEATPEQYLEVVEIAKKKQIENDVDDIASGLIGHLINLGYNISEAEHQKEVFLLMEALVALLYKANYLEHYLHAFNPVLDLPIMSSASLSDFLSTANTAMPSATKDPEID